MAVFCGCSEEGLGLQQSEVASKKIIVGGIDTEGLMTATATTRAVGVPAETIGWLVQPLKNGLDITYGLYNATPNHQDVAILKLTDTNMDNGKNYDTDPKSGLAVYSFKYRADRKAQVGEGNDAIWHNNGYHYFQGVHVPERIRYTTNVSEVEDPGKAPALTTDQHNDNATGEDSQLGNYTLLSHYLGMPANYRLTATVERIMLPFRHRLARVVAFVLIDPELNTTLKGYKKNADGTDATEEDPNTTSIRFCNVKVLQGVKDVVGVDGHHELTPKWTQARKIIPHFDGERGSYSYKESVEANRVLDENFKYYYKESDGKMDALYPTTANWKSVHDAPDHKGYTEVNYGKVPVYDIIVRPTYSTLGNVSAEDNVMYDEENYATQKKALADQTNSIDFEMELANGLRYEKRFEFDLNANYQTVVYLRISREHVDYNASGSDLWIEDRRNDAWYGVDNQNGNTLSLVGSSWQRAYTYGESFTETPNTNEGVTDGHFYNSSTSADEREKAQYFTAEYKDIWVEKFLQAYKGGEHHGDYFILRSDITIDAAQLPIDFVFTGHLDGQDKTITLTGVNEWRTCDNEVLAKLKQKTGVAGNDDDYTAVPQLYWMKEIAQTPPRTRAEIEIPLGTPIPIPMGSTLPASLLQLDREGKVVLYKDGDDYNVYTNRTFYKKTGSSLFDGLDGTYTTAQEANPSILVWEANVHRETNKTPVWVPTPGYRAETLNVKMAAGATLFKDEAVVTGNVQNCWNGDDAIENHTPNIPQYK